MFFQLRKKYKRIVLWKRSYVNEVDFTKTDIFVVNMEVPFFSCGMNANTRQNLSNKQARFNLCGLVLKDYCAVNGAIFCRLGMQRLLCRRGFPALL